jgi:hypothetical protein
MKEGRQASITNREKHPLKGEATGLGGSLPPGDSVLGEPLSRVGKIRLTNNKQAFPSFHPFWAEKLL